MENQNDINFDPTVLEDRSTTYSSLTDINGANVFSTEFQNKVKDYKEQTNQAYQTLHKGLFIKQMNVNSNIYEEVKNEMFHSREIKIIKNTNKNDSNGLGLAIPILGITFVMVILIMIRYVEKRRRKWVSHEVDTYI